MRALAQAGLLGWHQIRGAAVATRDGRIVFGSTGPALLPPNPPPPPLFLILGIEQCVRLAVTGALT